MDSNLELMIKDLPPDVSLERGGRIGRFLSHRIFPLSIFLLLTGMFWIGDHGLYPRLFYWAMALPAVLSIACSPKNVRHLLASRIVVAYLLFACYMVLTVLWSTSQNSTVDLVKRPLFVLLFFYSAFELGRQRFDLLAAAVKWAAVIAVVAGIYTLGLFVSSGANGRLTGYGALFNPLMVSHVFGFFLAWWLGLYFIERRVSEPLMLAAVLILAALLLATGSRTPMVAMTATIFWLSAIAWNRKSVLAVGMLITAVAMIWLFAPEILTQRGFSYRTEVWTNVLRQIGEKPWFGHGFNTPIWVKLDDIPYPLHDPHNLTLSVFFDGGVIGGLFWLALYLVSLVESWRWRTNKWVMACSATVIYGLMSGMTEGGAFLPRPKEHWFLVWIPLALTAAAIYQARICEMNARGQETTGANG